MEILTGTEKQVAWAEQIREQKLAEVDYFVASLAEYAAEGFGDGDNETINERINELRSLGVIGFMGSERPTEDELARERDRTARLRQATTAAWWIRHRYSSPRELLHTPMDIA